MSTTPFKLHKKDIPEKSFMTTINYSSDMSLFQDKNYFVNRAKLSDAAGRYEDMVKYVEMLINTGKELNAKEMALVSYAYKSLVKEKKKQFNTINQIYSNSSELDERKFRLLEEMRNKIAQEIRHICLEVVSLLDKSIFPKMMDGQMKVCYLMMRADHYRYLAEISPEDKKSEYANISLKIYQEATDIARTQLASTNLDRLNLALNLSVLYFDVLNSSRSACIVAKQAFDEAIVDIENVNEDNLQETTIAIKILTDNLTLWEAGHQETVQNQANNDDDDF